MLGMLGLPAASTAPPAAPAARSARIGTRHAQAAQILGGALLPVRRHSASPQCDGRCLGRDCWRAAAPAARRLTYSQLSAAPGAPPPRRTEGSALSLLIRRPLHRTAQCLGAWSTRPAAPRTAAHRCAPARAERAWAPALRARHRRRQTWPGTNVEHPYGLSLHANEQTDKQTKVASGTHGTTDSF